MRLVDYKKFFINILIGSLVGAAVVAVTAVLAGGFNDTLGKTLLTLCLVAVHALAAMAYIDTSAKKQDGEELNFFSNIFFVIIMLSFFTSVLGVWGVIAGDIVARLYATYGIVLFATLHGELLAKTTGVENKIDNTVYANYLFMTAVVMMLIPVVWAVGFDFGEVYYRILAALAIIDFTLTALVAIFHRLYLQKNPKATSPVFTQVYDANGKPILIEKGHPKRRIHPLIWVLIIFLAAQFVLPILFLLLRLSFA